MENKNNDKTSKNKEIEINDNTDKVDLQQTTESNTEQQNDNPAVNSTKDTPQDKKSEKALTPQEKITQLEDEIAYLKDVNVRAQAEIQNVQRRSIEEVKKARDYAFSSFAKDIVVVKDYLEMALADQSGNVDTMKTGVDLTLKQLIQIFERNYIKEIAPKTGDKLDPHLHQAMNSVEAEGQESNTIVNTMQKGYTLNSRVIRPAMVAVAK